MVTSPTLGHEYIKVILQNKRMVGAILIGDTDLEVKLLEHRVSRSYKLSIICMYCLDEH